LGAQSLHINRMSNKFKRQLFSTRLNPNEAHEIAESIAKYNNVEEARSYVSRLPNPNGKMNLGKMMNYIDLVYLDRNLNDPLPALPKLTRQKGSRNLRQNQTRKLRNNHFRMSYLKLGGDRTKRRKRSSLRYRPTEYLGRRSGCHSSSEWHSS